MLILGTSQPDTLTAGRRPTVDEEMLVTMTVADRPVAAGAAGPVADAAANGAG